jgi:glyoxylase-like metal-dependent hydrolase (beta-lactamase superfamily II)
MRCALLGRTLLTAIVATPASWTTAAAEDARITLDEVAPGVFAALQPHERRFDDANTLVVACAEWGALLVDPPSDRARLQALVDEIRRRGWQVAEVVSSHWHSDHTQGTAAIVEAFGSGIDRIGHETLTQDVPDRAAAAHHERVALYEREIPAARDRLARRVRRDGSPLAAEDVPAASAAIDQAAAWLADNRDARFLSPTTTYATRLVLERCGRRIELVHFRAHTRGDTVVRLPAEGVVATGDLLDDLPYVGHGHPRSWVATLDEIDGWDTRVFVPGHGPLLRSEDKLQVVRGFLRDLVAATDAAHARGASSQQAGEGIDLERWRAALAAGDETAERFFDQTIDEAVARAFDELSEDGSR